MPYTVRLTHGYWMILQIIAIYMRRRGIAYMTKMLSEKLSSNMVCILIYLKFSLRFFMVKNTLAVSASYNHFFSMVIIYLVYVLRQFMMFITPNQISRNTIVVPCNHQETAIFRTVSRYMVGEIMSDMMPNSNMGKKSALPLFRAFLMFFFSSLR